MPAHQDRRVALIVEDDSLVRAAVVAEFEDGGWTVFDAASGEDAIALLPGQVIDIVFTDIELAGHMSGWDVVDRLRSSNPSLPVVYTSGDATDRSRQVEGSLFFAKPYDPADVLNACGCLCESDR